MAPRMPGKVGRIRQADDSLTHVGIKAGTLIIIDLETPPQQDELCAAFTSEGDLVVRYFHKEKGGYIRLTTSRKAQSRDLFDPGAVMIFGRVREVVKTPEAV